MLKSIISRFYSLVILFSIFFTGNSCKKDRYGGIQEYICGLASPLVFTRDTLALYMQDYFTDPSVIGNIIFPDNLSAIPVSERSQYTMIRKDNLRPLSVIAIETVDGQKYSILLKNLKKEKVTINFNPGNGKYAEVKVRGSLNRWNAKASKMSEINGIWTEEFELVPGEYQYLLVADGVEMINPSNTDSIDNNMGGFNSLLKVGKYQQEDLPFLRTVSYNNTEIHLTSTEELSEVYAFWQNRQLDARISDRKVLVKIPREIIQSQRSFIRVFACNEKGLSNDILIPMGKGEIVRDPSVISRFDRHSMIMYFMMIDRFRNGNPENDEPVNDPEILPKANYFGGDLEGILETLRDGYFDILGVNTIWLSPISQNPVTAYGLYKKPHTRFSGYHGYWPVSSTRIDYRFGTAKEFQDLVDETHEQNKNILLDYVANHVHELHPVYLQHPDWATELYLPDGTLNTERWDEYRLTTWFDTFLPTLDLRRPEVVDPMTDSAIFWIKEYGIDGFRHDATKHIDELYWRTLTHKLKKVTSCNPMIYQIGETYGSPELISSYISTGMLDGQFDFNVYDDAVAVFARDSESFERLKNSLTQSLRYYGYHSVMGYITGNQDRPRFISLAGGSLKFEEDSKYAGWNRRIEVGNLQGYDKLKLLHAFNMTIPGIPIIYYGDELGIPGGNDPDNRRWMKFDDLSEPEQDVKSTVQKLTGLRTSMLPLIYGDLQILHCDKNSFAFIRNYFDDFVLVVFNKSQTQHTIILTHELFGVKDKVAAHFGASVEHAGDTISMELAPISFEIITN
ncbi:1,4-alpha-glucan branching enzyme GlgB [subsurface metagenome]